MAPFSFSQRKIRSPYELRYMTCFSDRERERTRCQRARLRHAIKPYYSSKYRLGNLLWNLNERKEAINEFFDLLRLCPEDRHLIRGVLLSWLIAEGLDKETEEVLSMFKNDYLSATKFSRAPYLFKLGKLDDAERALRIANASNPFVISYIIKQKRLPKVQPELKKLDSEEDAIYYVRNAKVAWDSVEGSRNWVKDLCSRVREGALSPI